MTNYALALLSLTFATAPAVASADDGAQPSPSAAPTGLFKAWAIQVGLASAGPVMFRDTPDMRLDDTTVFEYGGRLGVVFGNEEVNPHRVGLALRYDLVARSADRKLAFVTPQLVYEVGHPLSLQLGVGYAAALGTAGYADEYGGISTDAALRWTLRQPRASAVAISFGLAGRVVLHTADVQQSSAFVGAQVELAYRGGAR